jgi:hypothetical protein
MIQFTPAEAAFAVLLVAFKYLTVLLGVCIVLWLAAQSGGRAVTASRIALGVTGFVWAISLGCNVWAFFVIGSGDDLGSVLTKPATVEGYPLGGGDTVFRNDDGHVVRVQLAEPRMLADLKVSGEVQFDGAGHITRAHLAEAREIEGIPCAGDADAEFSAGRLARCTLARGYKMDGVSLPVGTQLHLSPELWHAFLPDNLGTSVGAIAVPAGVDFRFDRAKRHVIRINVRGDRWVVVDGLRLTGAIDFTEDGRLDSADVFDAVDIGGEHHPAGTFVDFSR